MRKLSWLAVLFLSIALMSACSKESSKPTNPEPTKPEPTTEVAGDEVFQKSCMACHSSGDLTGGQITLDSDKIHNDFSTEAALSAFVRTKMPKSAPGTLSKEEYEAVVKYLWEQK